ncbi:hypothetical protein GF352_00720, partial [archaeon]|nr:hypothetical protein [archaeon]
MTIKFGNLKNLVFFLEHEVSGLSVKLARTPSRLEGGTLYLWMGDFGVNSPSTHVKIKLKREHYSLLGKYLDRPAGEVKSLLKEAYNSKYKDIIRNQQ